MPTVENAVTTLIAGERLSREEFLRRWELLPNVKQAELIDGVVYMSSPVSNTHGKHHGLAVYWLFHYAAHTPGCEAGPESTWLMLSDAPQPDVHLRLRSEYGGQSRLEGSYCTGAPELIFEVCLTSAAHDLGPKLELYRKAGVRE